MSFSISSIKQKLSESISHICEASTMFSRKPGVYFTRDRKLPLREVISCLLSMEGKSLTPELLKYFGCSADTASSSAFVQQRSKISEDAFPTLFSLFVQKTDSPQLYKVEYITQEIFAKLTMYNFCELITSHVVIQKKRRKYVYQTNFTAAVHICRQFFIGNVSPPDVKALIQKFVSPIRPGRSRPRIITGNNAVSFTYRVANFPVLNRFFKRIS